ncbi:MAG: winged helix-turn-helix transcriptional regulator [Methanofollis sp.]|nr:winged helix-turn-helix transcriptional regulator [Methanofollis sp.]
MEMHPLFFILLSGLLIAPPAAALGGYAIAPAVDIPFQEYHDFDEISFYDLSPRMMVIELALFLSPAFLLPAEILYSLVVISCLGFRRVTRQTVLDHEKRRVLYIIIRENPGICFSSLKERARMNVGTTRYHLRLLTVHDTVACRSHHGAKHYYVRNGDYSRMEAVLLTYRHNENARLILNLLSRDAELSHQDLMAATDTTSSTISWHMKRLVADGVAASYRKGRKKMYLLTPTASEAFRTAKRETDHMTTSESGPVPG